MMNDQGLDFVDMLKGFAKKYTGNKTFGMKDSADRCMDTLRKLEKQLEAIEKKGKK